jgi:mRNA interferase RelE/StbE
VSRYLVYVSPQAQNQIKALPGHMRQRVKRAIQQLADDPRPAQSRELRGAEVAYEARRLRLDKWRIVYTISDADNVIDILTVRQRPPYDYGDLAELLEQSS